MTKTRNEGTSMLLLDYYTARKTEIITLRKAIVISTEYSGTTGSFLFEYS